MNVQILKMHAHANHNNTHTSGELEAIWQQIFVKMKMTLP